MSEEEGPERHARKEKGGLKGSGEEDRKQNEKEENVYRRKRRDTIQKGNMERRVRREKKRGRRCFAVTWRDADAFLIAIDRTSGGVALPKALFTAPHPPPRLGCVRRMPPEGRTGEVRLSGRGGRRSL